MSAPDAKQVLAPFGRGRGLQGLFALLEFDPGLLKPLFNLVQLGWLPELKQHRIVGEVIAVVERDQIVRPDITLGNVVKQVGNLVKVLTIMRQQGIIHTQHPLGFQPRTS